MFKKIGFLWVLIVFMGAATSAQSPQNLWQEAKAAYEKGDFAQAKNLYETLLADKKADDQVYYNLGNTYYRLKQPGKAILNYKRALAINPGNVWAKENIDFIYSKTPNAVFQLPEIFFIRWVHSFLGFASANVWAWITFGFFLGVLAVLYLKLFKQIKNGYRWLSFAVVLFLLSSLITYVSYQQRYFHDEAVVMLDKAVLHEHNDPNSKLLLMLPEGTTIKILSAPAGTLQKVRLSNGTVGWIDPLEIEKI